MQLGLVEDKKMRQKAKGVVRSGGGLSTASIAASANRAMGLYHAMTNSTTAKTIKQRTATRQVSIGSAGRKNGSKKRK